MSNELEDLKNSLANAHHEIERLKKIIFKDDYEDDDDERYDDWDEEDYQERILEERADVAANCKCGAWQFNKIGDVVHVADCCCGAE